MKIRTSKIILISPIGFALIAYVFFWACTFVPPNVYQKIMHENNYMFLHLPSHLLVGACFAAFIFGATVVRRKAGGRPPDSGEIKTMHAALVALPIVALSVINIVSIVLLLDNNPNLLMGWLSDGRAAKMDLDATGAMTNALPALYASCWWGLWRLMEREHARGKKEWMLRVVVCGATLIAIYSALIKVARYDLLPCVFGLAVVYLAHRHSTGKLKLARSMTSFGGMVVAVAALFLVMAWLRGSDEIEALSRNVIGYTAASYNRLAALLDGEISFPYSGTGVYSFKFLTYIPVLNRWVDFASVFGMPSKEDAWISEFGAIAQSGLDGSYIWVSAFGYIYSDIGLLSILYFFFIGLASSSAWRSMILGRVGGLTIYPWIAFSILFWMGDNFLAYSKVIVFVATALSIGAYERIVRAKQHQH